MTALYENLMNFYDDFPVIFHLDVFDENTAYLASHWHESVEILCFVSGDAVVHAGASKINITSGDILVINSNEIHSLYSDNCSYYCLLTDYRFCLEHGIDVTKIQFNKVVKNSDIYDVFMKIADEINRKDAYYKTYVKSMVISIFVRLCREYSIKSTQVSAVEHKQNTTIKKALDYIREHFTEDITIDMISEHVGMSKYYFCRLFKERTGDTVLSYIHMYRCKYARELIRSGYNVAESSEKSGYTTPYYFSKVYKKYMGVMPSKDKEGR